MLYKDAVLDTLSESFNVAQFMSFAPDLTPRFAHVRNRRLKQFSTESVQVLLESSSTATVNVRSFDPSSPQGNEFIYGLGSRDEVVANLRRLAGMGLYTIVNETIDVRDGGVSGVVHGDTVEFAPGDTPRAVEKPGVAAMPRGLGLPFLRVVYGFDSQLDRMGTQRVEFSLHPLRVGVRNEHTIFWEIQDTPEPVSPPIVSWPNRFSEFLGDKVFGLAVAFVAGLPVPGTTVFSRDIAPFTFGRSTGTGESWLRTAPRLPKPGLFTTVRGWRDPFALMQEEDPGGTEIASVVAQEGVASEYAGGARLRADDSVVVEGVSGWGDDFMLGREKPERLPHGVVGEVDALLRRAWAAVGIGSIEWAHDGSQAWILQAHRGMDTAEGQIIYPGQPESEVNFDVADGLEGLRALVDQLRGTGVGIVVQGQVGITSHFGDVLRRAKIPARLG